jgi:hypothetical protein
VSRGNGRRRRINPAWWDRRPWNLGAAVGRSGLVVIDRDQSKGQNAGAGGGIDVLGMLAERAGQPAPWDTGVE